MIESKDLSRGFLPRPSRIKVNTLFTLEKAIVVKTFGKVKEYVMEKVKEEFYKLF